MGSVVKGFTVSEGFSKFLKIFQCYPKKSPHPYQKKPTRDALLRNFLYTLVLVIGGSAPHILMHILKNGVDQTDEFYNDTFKLNHGG